MVRSGQITMDHYLKVFGKVVDEAMVRHLCSVFQKLMKLVAKNLYPVVALQITRFFYLFSKKSLFIVSFLVILHKSTTLTVIFIKRIYFKSRIEKLTTNH